jgi:single-strand DNA-binding protein
LALGSRAHSLALPSVTRAGYGKFNETEITTMYSNKVTLIGFTGADAEVRTNNDRSLTTLSLATKLSGVNYFSRSTTNIIPDSCWNFFLSSPC